MQIQRYINGKKVSQLPKKIENEAVRDVLSRAAARFDKIKNE